ncbi:MAG: hypothetical protein K8M05_12080 [Deltaproteobacteria bacterium]|nr:hypothetical protein [Kofleriaceae bacterium]
MKKEAALLEFVKWFKNASSRLLQLPPDEAADEIGEHLIERDGRLGVEVADEADGTAREMVVTAFSDPEAFQMARYVVNMLVGTPGWQVVALKPARGFAFNLEVGSRTLDASQLMYVDLTNGGIGLVVSPQVFALLPEGRETEELAWLVVEGGIGEELAAQLNHIEFISAPRAGARPIQELAAHVASRGT